jgi:hypothetical protein
MRFSEGFTNSDRIKAFEAEMKSRGVEIRWGNRDGQAFAYVPKTDAASIMNLSHTEAARAGAGEAFGAAARGAAETAERSSSLLGRFGRMAGRLAGKLLVPLGIVMAGEEVMGLRRKAEAAVREGQMPEEARLEYENILSAHSAQSIADPTLVGGEHYVRSMYNQFADRYHLSPELRESLRPSGLLPGPIVLTPDQRKFFERYEAIPGEATADMPPEVAALVEAKRLVEQSRARMTEIEGKAGGIGFDKATALMQAKKDVARVEELFLQQYQNLLNQNHGGMAEVDGWIAANHRGETAHAPLAEQARQPALRTPPQQPSHGLG